MLAIRQLLGTSDTHVFKVTVRALLEVDRHLPTVSTRSGAKLVRERRRSCLRDGSALTARRNAWRNRLAQTRVTVRDLTGVRATIQSGLSFGDRTRRIDYWESASGSANTRSADPRLGTGISGVNWRTTRLPIRLGPVGIATYCLPPAM